jgi:pimeloyl-ACP methyl ester carboxylesterase
MAAPVPRHEDTVNLPDGRKLGWAEYGAADGRPVLWFHGTPGARRQLPPDAGDEAHARGLRIITVERPGAGWSTPHLYRNIRAFADDIAVLADELRLDQFACVGLSGGGPYTLACAHELPDRVTVAAVLGGLGPVVGPEIAPGITRLLVLLGPLLGAAHSPLSAGFAWLLKGVRPFGSLAFDIYATIGPHSDRAVLRRPEMKEVLLDDLLNALDHEMRAPIYDFALFARDWGFSLADIKVPVRFWQGDADLIVPLSHSGHQAGLVSDSAVVIRPGEGHFAGYNGVSEVFDTVVLEWPAAAQG